MASWRNQSFWSKVWTYALVALIGVFTIYTGTTWPDGNSSGRKRVFSPGFVVVCVFVAVVEMILLNHFYGVRE
ncbi:hypothetical protein [Pseudomonas sp. Ost2]|uniref:hypothetical protein n=1 Tax=Pseudomonas sp. Ost2 TaxID=2678260 RepID=UPI001BB34B88|nr:hypothetical protein [Pseudomonas sp. Ost2]